MNLTRLVVDIATDKSAPGQARCLKAFLSFVSFLYGTAIFFLSRLCLRMAVRLPVKVISVGNITAGGTGKTVIVQAIASYLSQSGRKVAILTRGYGRSWPGKADAGHERWGDEAAMMKRNLPAVPVIVDSDRVRGARFASASHGADTVVLDDGFQQWKVRKDFEIAAIDALNAFGNNRLIPRGILREPSSALVRADVIIITNADGAEKARVRERVSLLAPGADIVEAVHAPTGFYKLGGKERIPAESFSGTEAGLVSGVGNPRSFHKSCERLGIKVSRSWEFPDHHEYSGEEYENILAEARRLGIRTLITTEKDAVKLELLAGARSSPEFFVLAVALKITHNEELFYRRLNGIPRP